MKKHKLDLSMEVCHSCDSPLKRDLKAKKEHCVNKQCMIRNIDFSIPYEQEEEKK